MEKQEFLQDLHQELVSRLAQNGCTMNDFAEVAGWTLKDSTEQPTDKISALDKDGNLRLAVMYGDGTRSIKPEKKELFGVFVNGCLITAVDAPQVLTHDEALAYCRQLPSIDGKPAHLLGKKITKKALKNNYIPLLNAILEYFGKKPILYGEWWMEEDVSNDTAWLLNMYDGTDGKSKFIPEEKDCKNFVRVVYYL